MRSIQSLTFGYIPHDWCGNSEDSLIVEIGNSQDFNKVKDLSFKINETEAVCGNVVIKFDEVYDLMDEDSRLEIVKHLNNTFGIQLDDAAFAACLAVHVGMDEWEEVDNPNVFSITWEGPEFSVSDNMKGCVYFHSYCPDDDHEDIVLGITI